MFKLMLPRNYCFGFRNQGLKQQVFERGTLFKKVHDFSLRWNFDNPKMPKSTTNFGKLLFSIKKFGITNAINSSIRGLNLNLFTCGGPNQI